MKDSAPKTSATRRVLSNTALTDSAFILRFERGGLEFLPGQYVSAGVQGQKDQREYSLYSPVSAPYLEILVKTVEGGRVSQALSKARPGDELEVQGPFGFFLIDPLDIPQTPFLFIATGTGISPFHCFANSYPGLDYQVLHGVRTLEEAYGRDGFDPGRHKRCVSGQPGGDYSGRVTSWLQKNPTAPGTHCYLCGNCGMIYEVYDLLKSQGIPSDRIFSEVYF